MNAKSSRGRAQRKVRAKGGGWKRPRRRVANEKRGEAGQGGRLIYCLIRSTHFAPRQLHAVCLDLGQTVTSVARWLFRAGLLQDREKNKRGEQRLLVCAERRVPDRAQRTSPRGRGRWTRTDKGTRDEPPPPNSSDISHRSALLLVEWKGSTATEVRNLVVTKDIESRKDE